MEKFNTNFMVDIIGKGKFSSGEDVLATVRAHWKATDHDASEGMITFRSNSGVTVSHGTIIVGEFGRFEVVQVNQSVNKQFWEVAVCKENSTRSHKSAKPTWHQIV